MAKRKTDMVTARVPSRLREEFEALCEEDDRTPSQQIRRLMRQHVTRRREGAAEGADT